ncbi:single-stranded DNA-binding protein [Macrococcoides bohemicum]|uniref:ERF family protein n=1 Tax=Macrococcoides bohemicum TaxID=1903056 RepID=UPI00105930A1|nr:ERF family protein [Macrococcus bohemicus]TDL39425.1 single-stranded DNA-binding protein [Macrococcus bohemicus]
MTEKKLNLFQKIADVKKSIEGFTKDTKGFNYNYVSGSQVLHSIRAKMEEHNLLFIPRIENAEYKEIEVLVKGQKKPNILVAVTLTYTWIDADNPADKFEIPFYAIGHQDDASKALGTALTYSERYLLMKQFNIPTDEDDADAKQKKEKYTPKELATSQDIGEVKKALKQLVSVSAEGTSEAQILKYFMENHGMPEYFAMTKDDAIAWTKVFENEAEKRIKAKENVK